MLRVMFHVILYQPRIPQNTGNIGRLCAVTSSSLHLIHPLGFSVADRDLKRSGMDYWKSLQVHHHEGWEQFLRSPLRPRRVWLFTTKTDRSFWKADFHDGDGLLFGNEVVGCPQAVHEWVGPENRLTIPRFNVEMRSLNLSTSVGIAVYEALRQVEDAGL